jgi:hypothetical protein
MPKKGDRYQCDDCGLVVLVEDACDCVPECKVVCCDQPMKKVTTKAPAKAPAKEVAKKTDAKK